MEGLRQVNGIPTSGRRGRKCTTFVGSTCCAGIFQKGVRRPVAVCVAASAVPRAVELLDACAASSESLRTKLSGRALRPQRAVLRHRGRPLSSCAALVRTGSCEPPARRRSCASCEPAARTLARAASRRRGPLRLRFGMRAPTLRTSSASTTCSNAKANSTSGVIPHTAPARGGSPPWREGSGGGGCDSRSCSPGGGASTRIAAPR